ncbi:sugar transferase [Paenalcaligenes niemegkensis]|uniref:sugar transferase n=1 Tax=Paenalcaligenes niemegkensis TaxID=2895469 RepID=UPI001EE98918|nr:sugar transferase [Paenalcaligenes niemegkensis]MCQ9618269.1 sugar transferase [Paenalcaligenes niemegkensis]
MTPLSTRRYTKLYEQVLLARWFSFVCGWLITVLLPTISYWGLEFWRSTDLGLWRGMLTATSCLLIAYFLVSKTINHYPGGQNMGVVLGQVFVIYVIGALVSLLLRIELSRFLLVTSGLLALVWFCVDYQIGKRFRRPKMALIMQGNCAELLKYGEVEARPLYEPDLQGVRYDGVVADLAHLSEPWQRFVTHCVLDKIAVYDSSVVFEAITGRSRIMRMAENNLGALLPSTSYLVVKGLLEWLVVFLSLPITLPIMAITAIAIKLDSPGPVLYKQTRVGQGNKEFLIYKFRSMYCEDNAPARFAESEDPRVTRIGAIIRRYRIDELPQFLNILKGEMSLVGPRPEQPTFAKHFDDALAFYSYRHVVKPGITGWAQVRQGYAADTDDTQFKIEHDFYYIKHASVYLDIYILLLTAKTVLTGFGAR